MKVINCGSAASSITMLLILFRVPFNTAENLRLQQRHEPSCHADSLPVSRSNNCTHNRCLGKSTAVNKAACTQRWTKHFVFMWKPAWKGEGSVDTAATRRPAAAAASHRSCVEHKSRRGGPDLPRPSARRRTSGQLLDACFSA